MGKARRLSALAMALLALLGGAAASKLAFKPKAPPPDPIAIVGHGVAMDAEGKRIAPTIDWIAGAQANYRARIEAALPDSERGAFADYEKRLRGGLKLDRQGELLIEQRLLAWLIATMPEKKREAEMLVRLAVLDRLLMLRIPENVEPARRATNYAIADELRRRLNDPALVPPQQSGTEAIGAAYMAECTAAEVPTPPAINGTTESGAPLWHREGELSPNDMFIDEPQYPAQPAELSSYQNADGVCMMLQRIADPDRAAMAIAGVICQSRRTGKACFWDFAMHYRPGTKIPIGVPNIEIDSAGRYAKGGRELLGSPGGICSDCHAGENAFYIHPDAKLDGGPRKMGDVPAARRNFRAPWAQPIVPTLWPQNRLPLAPALVPDACRGCHDETGPAGRLPRLSRGISGYCGFLKETLQLTMPPAPAAPGSELRRLAGHQLLLACRMPADPSVMR